MEVPSGLMISTIEPSLKLPSCFRMPTGRRLLPFRSASVSLSMDFPSTRLKSDPAFVF